MNSTIIKHRKYHGVALVSTIAAVIVWLLLSGGIFMATATRFNALAAADSGNKAQQLAVMDGQLLQLVNYSELGNSGALGGVGLHQSRSNMRNGDSAGWDDSISLGAEHSGASGSRYRTATANIFRAGDTATRTSLKVPMSSLGEYYSRNEFDSIMSNYPDKSEVDMMKAVVESEISALNSKISDFIECGCPPPKPASSGTGGTGTGTPSISGNTATGTLIFYDLYLDTSGWGVDDDAHFRQYRYESFLYQIAKGEHDRDTDASVEIYIMDPSGSFPIATLSDNRWELTCTSVIDAIFNYYPNSTPGPQFIERIDYTDRDQDVFGDGSLIDGSIIPGTPNPARCSWYYVLKIKVVYTDYGMSTGYNNWVNEWLARPKTLEYSGHLT